MRRLVSVPNNSKIVAGARPTYLEGRRDFPAILLLHGYTGYPGDMRYLGGVLNGAGYSVSIPRLPGHGTNGDDFRSSHARDWWRRAIDAYLELTERGRPIVVAGLSMGGLLATLLAAQFPVSGLMVYAPAFQTTNRLIGLTPLLRWVVPPHRKNPPETHEDPERQFLADQYWNWNWPNQAAGLLYLMGKGRRALSKITVPTFTVVSSADRAVPVSVAELIDARIATDDHFVMHLSESGHVVVNDSERETVANASVNWLSDARDGNSSDRTAEGIGSDR